MMSRRAPFLVVAFFVLLAGCGGGGRGLSALPTASPTTAPSGSGPQTGTLSFSISIPTTAAMKAHRPEFVSANTQSLAIFVYAAGAQPGATPTTTVNVGTSALGCTLNSAQGLITCTILVTAPVGNDELQINAMSGTNGTGSILSSVTQSVTVTAGTQTVPVTLDGTPALIKLSLETPVLALGTAGTSILDVDAYDATGALIVAPGSFTTPITISSSSTAVSLASTSATAPGTKITLTYGGSTSAPYAVQFTGSGGSIASNAIIGAVLTLEPSQSIAILSHSTTNNGFGTLALTSTTGVPQAFSVAGNPDTTDFISGGGFTVLPGGGYVTVMTPGSLTCTLFVYPAGSALGTQAATYGDQGTCAVATEPNGDILASDNTSGEELTEYSVSGTTLAATGRTIALNGSQVPGGLILPTHVAVNPSGEIAVMGANAGTNYVLTFTAGASGAASPAATATLGTSSSSGLAIGASGSVDVLAHTGLAQYQIIEYVPGLGSSVTVSANAPTGGSIIPDGVAIDAAGESLVLYATLTSTYVQNAGVDVWASGANSAPERTVPVQAALGSWGQLYGPQIVPSPAPPTSNTPVAGDMFGYVASRTWTYLVTPGYGTPYYIGIYADPNPVNGNIRFVGYQASSSSSLFTSGTKIGTIDLTQLNGSYLAAAFASVSSGTSGISGSVPGTPLLVPGSLALGQSWNPLQNAGIASAVGVTASAQVTSTGSVPGIGACPSGSGTSGATVQYAVTVSGGPVAMSPSFVSYVPGCGITSIQEGGVQTNLVLQSVSSMASLGQQDVPPGQPPIVAALHKLWQGTLGVHPNP